MTLLIQWARPLKTWTPSSKCMNRFIVVGVIYVCRFEDNWFSTTDDLKAISNEQWQELKIPMGLVNAIKKKLADASQP